MSRWDDEFVTHRCGLMPEGYSLRKYADNGKKHQWPEPGGWVLGMRDWDDEWDYTFLNNLTPWAKQHVRFCPWCGEELE